MSDECLICGDPATWNMRDVNAPGGVLHTCERHRIDREWDEATKQESRAKWGWPESPSPLVLGPQRQGPATTFAAGFDEDGEPCVRIR